jgi:class 3 adenylate cyclase
MESPSGGPHQTERRVITCLVLDVVGSTDLLVRFGPDRRKTELGRLFTEVERVVIASGGIIEKFLGDGVLAVFGVPVSHPDDARRALRAALSCVEEVDRLRGEQSGLRVRLAVESGETLVDVGASDVSREHGLVGTCVNVATRLQERAEPGQILVGPVCHHLTDQDASYEDMGQLALKGLGEVEAWRLVGLPDVHATVRPPFVGRTEELRVFATSYARAREGEPTLVVVVGPPGQGKSRLCEEFLTPLRSDIMLLFARCRPDDEDGSENPLRQLLADSASSEAIAALSRRLEDLVPEVEERARTRDALVHSSGLEVVAKFAGYRMLAREGEFLRGWRNYLSALATRRPVVVWVEDLHWADPSFIRLLDRLIETERMRLLIVATARPQLVGTADLRPSPRHVQFEIGPLDSEATATLARSLGVAPSAQLERAQGNPLFVLELAREPDHSGPVPVTVQAAIGAHIDELATEGRALLSCASVVGEEFTVRDVVVLCERSPADVEGTLSRLAHLRYVVRTAGGFAFHHRLVRDVVYARLATEDRLRLHVRYAKDGCGADNVETSAHHWWEAMGTPEADWVWKGDPDLPALRSEAYRRQMEAARRHMARASSDRAILVADRATQLASSVEEEAEAHELLGDIHLLRGDGDRGWKEYRRIIDIHRQAGRLPPARIYTEIITIPVWMWGTFRQRPSSEEVVGLIDEGIEVARSTGAEIALADLLVNRVSFTGAATGMSEALAAVEGSLDLSGLAGVLVKLAGVQSLAGDLTAALATCARIDDLMAKGAKLDDHQMLLWRFGAFYHAGELVAAERITDRVRSLAVQQSAHYRTHALGMLTQVRAARAQWREVRSAADETARVVTDNPAFSYCLIGASAIAWGAVGAILARERLGGPLAPLVERMVPESAAVRASILSLPVSMLGEGRYLTEAHEAYFGGANPWHRQIWDQFGVNQAIALTILERWDDLLPYLDLWEKVGRQGGTLLPAVADGIREEQRHARGGARPTHASLRRLGYTGLSELLSFRPSRSPASS